MQITKRLKQTNKQKPLFFPLLFFFLFHTANCPCACLTSKCPRKNPQPMSLGHVSLLPTSQVTCPWARYYRHSPLHGHETLQQQKPLCLIQCSAVTVFKFSTILSKGPASYVSGPASSLPVRAAPEGSGKTSLCSTLTASPGSLD